MSGSPLGEILLKAVLVSPRQLRAAEELAGQRNIPLAQALVELGICAEESLAEALRELTSLPRAPAGGLSSRPEALSRLPREAAVRYGLFPLAILDGGRKLSVAMIDPTDPEALDAVRRTTFAEPRPLISTVSQWMEALDRYSPKRSPEVPISTTQDDGPSEPSLAERLRALSERQYQVGRVLKALTALLAERGFPFPPDPH